MSSYFALPFLLLLLHANNETAPSSSSNSSNSNLRLRPWHVKANLVALAVVNAVLLYVFVNRPYKW